MTSPIEVFVPDIGGFKDVSVIDVLVTPGQDIEKETPLITIETEKAAMDVPAPVAGRVAEVSLKRGDKVSQGSLILRLADAAAGQVEHAAGAAAQVSDSAAAPARAAAAAAAPSPAAPPAPAAPSASAPAAALDRSRPGGAALVIRRAGRGRGRRGGIFAGACEPLDPQVRARTRRELGRRRRHGAEGTRHG